MWSHPSSSSLNETVTESHIAMSQVNDRFKLDWGTYLTTSKAIQNSRVINAKKMFVCVIRIINRSLHQNLIKELKTMMDSQENE